MITAQIGLVHSKQGFSPWLIRLVTRSYFSHVIVAVSDYTCVSAEPDGAQAKPIDEYVDVVWSQFQYTEVERQAIITYSLEHIGTPYSYWQFYGAGIAALMRGWTPAFIRRRIGDESSQVCSQLAWNALLAAGIDPFADDRPVGAATPATWGKYFFAHGWSDRP